MSKWVSPIEKRNFLKWFIQHQQLKRLEARKVIEYILGHFHILEKVSFTEKIISNGRTIVISSMNSDEPGFLFCVNQQKTEEVSKALGDLMMNPYENVYIVFHFSGKMMNHRYLQLIENPVFDNIKQYDRFQKYEKETDHLIDKIMHEKEIETIKKQIDEALDRKDAELFNQLTARLRQINQ